MRQLTVRDGEMKDVESIERGELLLLDEKGWLARCGRAYVRDYARFLLVSVPLMLFILAMGFILLAVVKDFVPSLQDSLRVLRWLLIYCILSLAYPLGRYYDLRMSKREGTPVPGMYENGLDIPLTVGGRVFIPFREIKKVEPGRSILLGAFYVFYDLDKEPLKVDIGFLGPDGLDLSRVKTTHAGNT